MNRHLSTEQLSAYLDSELGFSEMRQLESHCSVCGECTARLASMRRVVSGLGRVERAAPPVALRHQIRRAMAASSSAGREVVTVEFGAQPGPMTTSEVAGRKFFLTDNGWVQKGLEGETPVARVDAGSPQGRALLTKCSGLQWLLVDGSPVVLRYNLETVEIHHAPPTRSLGYEEPAPRPVIHARYSRSRVMEA
jgi:hypothetical protein